MPHTHVPRCGSICILPLAIRPGVVRKEGVLGLYFTNKPLGIFVVALSAVSSLRLMKMTRTLLGTRVLTRTVIRSAPALVIPFYLLFMLLTFFGTLVRSLRFDVEPNVSIQAVAYCVWG